MIDVSIEAGSKRSFAVALAWPGWTRSGVDEEQSIANLAAYAERYAAVLKPAGVEFIVLAGRDAYRVTGRLNGNASTDFGAPGVIPESDQAPLLDEELARWTAILQGSWAAFERAVQQAAGRSLRSGPRGGGRDVEKMIEHVLGGEQGYLSAFAWKAPPAGEMTLRQQLDAVHASALEALQAAQRGELPKVGPRGGVKWPARYYIRRAVWHILDHAWEIEDRIE